MRVAGLATMSELPTVRTPLAKGAVVYTLIRNVRSRDSLAAEVPGFLGAILIAEAFFKFHSFTLECIAFLATWLAISAVITFATRRLLTSPRAADLPHGE